MKARHETTESIRHTFTETARRAQIVEAAIQTIAELGYARASFAQIARRAGLSSTGLISYHFAGKDELIAQVVTEVYTAITQFMIGHMEQQSTATGALQIYIRANVAFIASHRTQMKALLDIFLNGGIHYDATTELVVTSPVEQILHWGQVSGDFRAFDTRVMAAVIQRAIDGLPLLIETVPDLDLDAYAREVATLFDLATRRTAR